MWACGRREGATGWLRNVHVCACAGAIDSCAPIGSKRSRLFPPFPHTTSSPFKHALITLFAFSSFLFYVLCSERLLHTTRTPPSFLGIPTPRNRIRGEKRSCQPRGKLSSLSRANTRPASRAGNGIHLGLCASCAKFMALRAAFILSTERERYSYGAEEGLTCSFRPRAARHLFRDEDGECYRRNELGSRTVAWPLAESVRWKSRP